MSKSTFALITITCVLFGCATAGPPSEFRPAASKTDMGYWEKILSPKGAYELHANLPASSDKKFRYLALRLGELCKAKGMNNFDPVGFVEGPDGFSLDRNPERLEHYQITGFCYANNVRRKLSEELGHRGEYVTVEKTPDVSELQKGDVVLFVGKKEVSTRQEVLLAVFELPDSQEKVELKILRDGEELTKTARLAKSSDEIFNVQDLYSLQREFE